MRGNCGNLFVIDILERTVVVSADLTELVGFVACVDGHDDGEQGGKKDCRQRDCKNGNQVSLPISVERFAAQPSDTFFILYFHFYNLPTNLL